MGGPDGNHEFGIPGIFDRHFKTDGVRLSERRYHAVSRISRGDDHHNAGSHQPVGLHAERALSAGESLRVEVVPYGEADHVDQRPGFVRLVDGSQRRDDVADMSRAYLVEHFVADQFALRCYTGDGRDSRLLGLPRAVGLLHFLVCADRRLLRRKLPANQTGDTGSEAERVDQRLAVTFWLGEIHVLQWRRQLKVAIPAEMRMGSIDSG